MKILIRIYKEAYKYWGYIVFAVLSLFVITASTLWAPGLMQQMVAVLEKPGASMKDIGEITNIAMFLLLAYFIQSAFRYLNNYYSHLAAWKFVSDIRVKIYNHMQKLSISYFHDKQTGQLMSRIINDTNAFETLIAHAIPELLSAIVLFVSVTIILFLTNVKLALLTCIPIPIILFGAPIIGKIRKQFKKAQIHIADLNGALQDNLSGIKEIQLFNKHEMEFEKIKDHSEKHAGVLIKALWYSSIFHPSISFFTSVGNVIVIGFGGYLALSHSGLSISEIVGFLMYLNMFYTPVSSFARIIEDMQSGIAGGERVFEVLDTQPEVKEAKNAIKVSMLSGKVEFKNVSFSYDDNAQILNNLSFEIPAKKMYAIVGATGVGKTTLAALLPRFYDVTAGEILFDGINIKDMTLESLRNNISMVLQDVFLFNGTLKDNILYGNPDATMEEVIQAAKMACIYDFIDNLPEKFETVVGERGMRLSGGQKQRISIARSLLSNSSILVLDEATSAVDTETEKEIQDAIQQIAGTRTLIVIAHRLSTVKSADCILVIENGELAEMGNHNELLEKNGIYKNLFSK